MIGEKMDDTIRNVYRTALEYPNGWSISRIQEAINISDDHRRHSLILDIYWSARELAAD